MSQRAVYRPLANRRNSRVPKSVNHYLPNLHARDSCFLDDFLDCYFDKIVKECFKAVVNLGDRENDWIDLAFLVGL